MEQRTCAFLVIGDEILNGQIQDTNISYLAKTLVQEGYTLCEVRVVGDKIEGIVKAVSELSKHYDFVFTSGGIGPTHDDQTADAIAKAFNVALPIDPQAHKILQEHYQKKSKPLNEARLRMARIPEGAELIYNVVSAAPGFKIQNVLVMAGVPAVFKAMIEDSFSRLLPQSKSKVMMSEKINMNAGEGDIAQALGQIQKEHPETFIGSYPHLTGENYTLTIVVRAQNACELHKAAAKIEELSKSI